MVCVMVCVSVFAAIAGMAIEKHNMQRRMERSLKNERETRYAFIFIHTHTHIILTSHTYI